ncbi:MAG: TrbG/VirB9 family P-type conjugative transfer protein [Acidobacteriota bacterium]
MKKVSLLVSLFSCFVLAYPAAGQGGGESEFGVEVPVVDVKSEEEISARLRRSQQLIEELRGRGVGPQQLAEASGYRTPGGGSAGAAAGLSGSREGAAVSSGDVPRSATVERLGKGPDRTDVKVNKRVRVQRFGEEEISLDCLPYFVCTLMLEPGEAIQSETYGDEEWWSVLIAYAGPDGEKTPVVSFSPTVWGIQSNAILGTSRRFYRVSLNSPKKPSDGVSVDLSELTLFEYPRVRRSVAEPPAVLEKPASVSAVEVRNQFFRYRTEDPHRRSKRFSWVAKAIFDDGKRIEVHLPLGIPEVPQVVALGSNGDVLEANAVLEEREDSLVWRIPFLPAGLELSVGEGRDRQWRRFWRN